MCDLGQLQSPPPQTELTRLYFKGAWGALQEIMDNKGIERRDPFFFFFFLRTSQADLFPGHSARLSPVSCYLPTLMSPPLSSPTATPSGAQTLQNGTSGRYGTSRGPGSRSAFASHWLRGIVHPVPAPWLGAELTSTGHGGGFTSQSLFAQQKEDNNPPWQKAAGRLP